MFNVLSTERLARASAARPKRVILAWLILFLAAGVACATLFEDAVTAEFNLLGSPDSKVASELLEERL